MKAFRALTLNVVRASFRNRTALFFTLVFAVMFMALFGWIFGNANVTLRLGLVDDDHSAASMQFIESLQHAPGLSVTDDGLDVELDRLRHDRNSLVGVIPPGFGRALAGTGPPVEVAVYQGNAASQTAGVARSVLNEALITMTAQGHPRVTLAAAQSASLREVRVIDYFLPAMIAYIILQSGINYVAIGLVDLRVRQVLRRYRVTPLTPRGILAAQICGGVLTVLLQIAVLVGLGLTVFGARVYGNWLVAAVPILVGTLAFVGIGFLLTSWVRTSEAARGVSSAIAFPMMFLSGIFLPIDQLPPSLQTAVHVLPLTWLSDALHQVLNDGNGIGSILGDLAVLLGWAVVCCSLAVWRFRWD